MTAFFQIALSLFFPIMVFIYNKENSESPFELFKLSVATIYIFTLFVIFLFDFIKKSNSKFIWNHFLSLLTLIVISNFISYLGSVNPYLSLWGDNLLPSDSLRSVLTFYLFSFLLVQFFKDYQSLKTFFFTLLITMGVSAIHGLLQSQGMDPTWSSFYGIVYGTIGNSSGYARLLGALIPLSLAFLIKVQNKIITVISFFIFVFLNLSLLYTAARIPILVNISVITLFIFFAFNKKNYKFNLLISLAAIIFTTLTYFIITPKVDGSNLISKAKSQYVGKSFEIRKILAENGIQAWLKNPFVGYGPETFSISQRPLQPLSMNKYQSWEFAWIKAHIEPIQILVCTGIVGLLTYLCLLIYSTYRAFRLFVDKRDYEASNFAFAFYCGYLFLIIANISAFNFIPTQMIAWSFPVLFSICLGEHKNYSFAIQQKSKAIIGLLFVILSSIFIFKNYFHWQADIQYQIARTNFEKLNNNVEAIKYNGFALQLNEREPIYYCQKAMIIEKTLRNNLSRISNQYRQEVLNEIEAALTSCTDFAINRDYMFWLKSEVYGSLFFNLIETDVKKVLKFYDDYLLLSPTNPKAHLQKSLIYLKINDEVGFQSEVQEALKLKADYIPAYIELVSFYYKKNNLNAVHELAQVINEIHFYASEQTDYLNDLASLAEMHQDTKGQKLFKEIAEKYKNFKDIN